MDFASDNTAGVHPRVMQAMAAANEGSAASYGADIWSARLNDALSAWFGREAFAFPVATGGAANALALSRLVPPWGAVLCHHDSHINVSECGAPEFYTHGAKLVAVDGEAARVDPAALRAALEAMPASDVHGSLPAAISITQATECGAVYGPDAVAAIAAIGRERGLKLHMDGARFSNALAHLGCAPADVTWRAGVDALSLGFTKNGAMAAEAVTFFDAALADGFARRRKRGGHLFSKMRFFAAQMLAMLEGDLWLDLARGANDAAQALARGFSEGGSPPIWPVEANEVFVALAPSLVEALRADGAAFHEWERREDGLSVCRFVCSWATTTGRIESFVERFKFHGSRI